MPALSRVAPREMLEWFDSAEGQSFKKTLAGDRTVPDAVMLQGFEQGPFRRGRQVVGYLASKNANFLFGTDTPSMPSYGNLPGLNGYLEMKQLRKAGLSRAQILLAATINNGRRFKIDSQVGTVEPGKIANLILLKNSPLVSVDAYDNYRYDLGPPKTSLAGQFSGRLQSSRANRSTQGTNCPANVLQLFCRCGET